MRIVLFSDVHGNVVGLEAVLAASSRQCSRTSAGPTLALVCSWVPLERLACTVRTAATRSRMAHDGSPCVSRKLLIVDARHVDVDVDRDVLSSGADRGRCINRSHRYGPQGLRTARKCG
jgi:hypothetical protein